MVIIMIYLDYNSTTPIDKDVLDTYIKTTNNFFANSQSLHKLGIEANHMYELSIKEIQKNLNTSHNIVFTSNATEANNIAILGYLKRFNRGRIITTISEHPSVYQVMKKLEEKFDVVYLELNEDGMINYKELEDSINKDTVLVSIMWVNNVIGTVNDINKVISILKKHPKVRLHVDTVQGVCKVEPNFSYNDIDMYTFSSHKINGPKGIGGLLYNPTMIIDRLLYGSNAQYGLKPGTFDLGLVVSTAKAFKKFIPLTSVNKVKVKEVFSYAYDKLSKIEGIKINTPINNVSYYCLNFSVLGFKGETVVRHLEKDEIYVSTASACSSKSANLERTIYSLTKDEERAGSSIRISFSKNTSLNDIDKLIESLMRLI